MWPFRRACDPIGVRAALRAFTGLADLGTDTYWRHRERSHATLLQATRAQLVSWAATTYDGVSDEAVASARAALVAEIAAVDAALPHFDADHAGMNAYGVDAMRLGPESARRALALVAWGIGCRPGRQPGTPAYGGPLDTIPRAGPEWVELQRGAEASDRALLAGGLAVRDLMLRRLWPDDAAQLRENDLALRGWERLTEQRFLGDNVVAWLVERRPGERVLGVAPRLARERIIRVANLPATTWKGRPAEEVRQLLDRALAPPDL